MNKYLKTKDKLRKYSIIHLLIFIISIMFLFTSCGSSSHISNSNIKNQDSIEASNTSKHNKNSSEEKRMNYKQVLMKRTRLKIMEHLQMAAAI